MDKFFIGKKLKEYRNRAGLSQFDLELEVEASPGSISRIESGQTNPTKETIHKISNILKLKPEERALLFGIELTVQEHAIADFKKIRKQSKKQKFDPYNLIQGISLDKILEDIIKELESQNFISPAIYLKTHNTNIYTLKKTGASLNSIALVKQILNKDIFEIEYTLNDETIISVAMLTGEVQFSQDSFELVFPHLGTIYSLQSIKKPTKLFAFPLQIYNNIIGCITVQINTDQVEQVNLDRLRLISEKAANKIYVAEVKEEFDTKFNNNQAKSTNLLLSNLKNLSNFQDLIKLFKSNTHFKLYTFSFLSLLSYWVFNQLFLDLQTFAYRFFTHVYFVMAAYAAYMGYRSYKIVGKNNTLGKMVFALTAISTCHAIGQITYSLVDITTNYQTPYPSIAEIFYLSATYISLYLSLFALRYVLKKYRSFKLRFNNLALFIFIGIMLFLSQYLYSAKDFNPTSSQFIASITDLAYAIGQTLAVLFSLIGLSILRKSTVSSQTAFFLVMYFYTSILLYIADFTFTFNNYWGNPMVGGINDLFYFLHYSFIGFGHLLLLTNIQYHSTILNRASYNKINDASMEDVVIRNLFA